MNRLERISSILVRLQSRSVVTARQIADQFGVSLRTVYRDIRVLEESGIPITGESGIGYSLADGFKLPPLMFSTEEAIAFLMAEKLISHQSDSETYGIYRSGMDKIRAVLRLAEKDILEDFDNYIQLIDSHTRPKSESPHVLQPLLHCILGKKETQIEYCANYNGETTFREIEPLGIFFMSDNWYLMAWCRLRQDYRTFNISRIRKIIPGIKNFDNRHPSLKTVLDTIYSNDVTYHIKLKVEKSALRNIGASRYLYGLYKEEEKDGYVLQYYATFSLEHFGRWFLSFADQATVLAPEELKEQVRTLVRNINI